MPVVGGHIWYYAMVARARGAITPPIGQRCQGAGSYEFYEQAGVRGGKTMSAFKRYRTVLICTVLSVYCPFLLFISHNLVFTINCQTYGIFSFKYIYFESEICPYIANTDSSFPRNGQLSYWDW